MDAGGEKNLRKQADAGKWLAAYADLLESANLPPSYPADRGDADAVANLPSVKDAEVPERDAVPYWLPPHIEADAREFAEGLGVKFGHFVHPVRAALTGTNKGPGLFDIVYLLGKERCIARLRARS